MKRSLFCFGLIACYWAQAQLNSAVNLDGSNDYVSLPSSVAVSQLSTFTVEAWVYWNGSGTGCIYSETVQGNNNPMFSIIPRSVDAGGIELVLRDNSATGLVIQPATATVTPNTWVHVAIVRTSPTNIKTYINGVLKDNATFTAPASWTSNKVNIGTRWRASQSDFFSGKIDELRIWNTARTATEIRENMFNKNLADNTSGLVAYYRFNEGSGTTAGNSSTNTIGVDGTFTNGPTWVNSPIEFEANALHFDQVDDKVLAPVVTTAISNVTMEAWVFHEGGTGTDHVIMANGVVGSNGYTLFVNTSHTLVVIFGGFNTWNTGVSLAANQWTHLALVISTTGFILYKNGVNVYANSGIPNTPTTNFTIGINNGVGQPFDGSIDEVRVWNSARTQSEIQNNMNGEIDPSTTGLAAYYTFNQGIADGDNSGMTVLIDHSGNGKNGTLTNFTLGGTTSNYVAQSNGLIVLPLQWLSFTATVQNKNVLLQWATEDEQNTRDFIVQHSGDTTNWISIATIQAKGNTSSQANYTYLHTTSVSGTNYYRISQRDIDGKFSYSATRSVKITAYHQLVEVMSNPVTNGMLQLEINGAVPPQVSLYSADGNLIWCKQFSSGIHSIDVSHNAKGTYFLKAGDGTKRLVLQ